MNNIISILSIDVGLKTLSFYKEYFDYSKIQLTPPKQKYNSDKSSTTEFQQFIRHIYTCGTSMYLEKYDLGNKNDYFSGKVFLRLIELLDKMYKEHIFDDLDIILIELQLKKNNIAQTLMYHIHSWFLIMFRDFKTTILYPSKNKTRILGAPFYKDNNKTNKKEKVGKYERKQWAVKIADEILTSRNEINYHNKIFIDNKSKKDDLSDVIIQCLSYNIKMLNEM